MCSYCLCQQGDWAEFYFCKLLSCVVTSFFLKEGSGCAWGYSELYLAKKDLVLFTDVSRCMGCLPPGDFICIQQCQGSALHRS